MLPPSTDGPTPPPAPRAPKPRFRPKPKALFFGLSRVELWLLGAIAAIVAIDVINSIDPEDWSAFVDWVWRAGTPEAIQPGIDVITGRGR